MKDVHIDGFEVLKKLGQGAMAEVWQARQMSLDRLVAIKILPPHMISHPSDIDRFHAEARSAAKLKHPGIVQVYDAGINPDLSYIVMEYVAGYTVGDWLRRKGTLSEEDALLVIAGVADAMEYAWSAAGIVHCDIKPDNIMIDADGTIKLADLGLARTLNTLNSSAPETDVLGTPAYMSPEQVCGRPDLDCRSDIYALGATLYHLVTGRPLFEGQATRSVVELQFNGTVAAANEVNSKLSRNACSLLERMLVKDRNARYRDWCSLKADIGRVRNGLKLSSRTLPKGASTMRRGAWRIHKSAIRSIRVNPVMTQRNRSSFMRVFMAASVAALLTLGFVVAGTTESQSREASVNSRPQRKVTISKPAEALPVQPPCLDRQRADAVQRKA